MLNSLLKLLGSTSFAQLLLVAISPILTRIYSPETFGIYVSVISIAYIINSISLARMDVALFSAKDDLDVSIAFSLGLYFTTVITLITLFSIIILDLVNTTKNYYYLIPLLVFTLSTYQLVIALFLRYEKINYVSKNKISQSTILGLGQVFLGLINSSIYSIVIAQSISFLLTTIFRFRHYRKFILFFNPINHIIRYKNFIIYDAGSNFLQKLSSNLTPILVTFILGNHIGGLYYMAYRVLIMPVSIFSVSIGQIISSKYILNINNPSWAQANDKALRVMMFIFSIPFAILATHVERIVPIIFGNDWVTTGTLIRYFSPWIFLQLVYASFSIHFSLNSKSKELMLLNSFLFASTVISFLILDCIGVSQIQFLIIIGFINAALYLSAIFYLSLKNNFKSGLNLLVAILSTIFIIIYPHMGTIYISILTLALYVIVNVIIYKNYNKSKADI